MLTHQVEFKAIIQKNLRIQIPVLIRWQFRLEPGEVFRVDLTILPSFDSEKFYGKMTADGRLTIPRRIAKQFLNEKESFDDLYGYLAEVTLEPIMPRGIKPQQLTERQVRDRDRGSDFKLRRI